MTILIDAGGSLRSALLPRGEARGRRPGGARQHGDSGRGARERQLQDPGCRKRDTALGRLRGAGRAAARARPGIAARDLSAIALRGVPYAADMRCMSRVRLRASEGESGRPSLAACALAAPGCAPPRSEPRRITRAGRVTRSSRVARPRGRAAKANIKMSWTLSFIHSIVATGHRTLFLSRLHTRQPLSPSPVCSIVATLFLSR